MRYPLKMINPSLKQPTIAIISTFFKQILKKERGSSNPTKLKSKKIRSKSSIMSLHRKVEVSRNLNRRDTEERRPKWPE